MPHKRSSRAKRATHRLHQAAEMRKTLSHEYHEEKKSTNRMLLAVAVMMIIAVVAALMLGFNLSR